MIEYRRGSTLTETIEAFSTLNGLENYYPGFRFWYINKVMPGVVEGRDILLTAREHGRIVGVALGKKRTDETKLRCVRVAPDYQGKGVGIHLMEKAIRLLDHDKPMCSVPEELIHDLSRPFVNLFRWNVTRVEKGLYRSGRLEYVFNGDVGAESPL
jgi:GNAT superfamily N-acetyltransferase